MVNSLPWFDMVVGAIVAFSAVAGFVRGGVREMVTATALILAAVIAVYGLRYSAPVAAHFFARDWPEWLAPVTAAVVSFVIVYALLRITGAALVRGIQSTDVLGPLDRIVGLGFGLIRALVVLGAFHLVFEAVTPVNRIPPKITGAAFYPLTKASGDTLKAFAPKGLDMADKLRPSIAQAVREGSVAAGGDSAGAGGYDPAERGGLDDLVEKSR